MRPVLAVLAALAALCASGAARADSAVVMIDSEADIMVESLVRVAAEDALRTAAVDAAPLEAAGRVTLETLNQCAQAPGAAATCFSADDGVTATQVLFLRIRVGEGDSATVIESYLFDGASGDALGGERKECSGCADPDRLAQTVEELVADILVTGQLEVEEEVAPVPDVVAPPPAQQESEPGRPYRIWKYVAIGSGVASVALGATLIAIDGPRIEDGVRKPEERASTAEGIAFVGVGVGLIATGAVLWIWDMDDARERERYVAPVVGESSVGAAWGGRF